MDCLKSFSVDINVSNVFTAADNGFDSWVIGTQNFWLWNYNAPDSNYTIDGFKNINIYKIEITGDVESGSTPAGKAGLVQNWNLTLQVIGQNANFGGRVTGSNGFGMALQPLNPFFKLSKYQRSIEFGTPIQSATQLNVTGFYADGISAEGITSIQLSYLININVFYKFEGE